MNILVTGANGFIGRNLCSRLAKSPHTVETFTRENTSQELQQSLSGAQIVFHLAGVNRALNDHDFEEGNVAFTEQLCGYLQELDRKIPIVYSSSIQAELDNPYGNSKHRAENVLTTYAEKTGHPVIIYRLTNVFGRWCRPNYNSVVATFCYNIARDLPITISDSDRLLELVHIDDVVDAFLTELESTPVSTVQYKQVSPHYLVSLGRLANLINSFRQVRRTLIIPALDDRFTHLLYSTYLSYLDPGDFAYALEKRCDPRGCLAEFVKSNTFGQIFVSRTEPGIVRGNHYHHVKTEKFLVLEGEALIQFRHIWNSDNIIEYHVRGEEFKVVDIPPGYTHSIKNVGQRELITLFWASEIFDPSIPDTTYLDVQPSREDAS